MVPYEAFLSEKPVLTTTDAGGPLEVVPTAAPDSSPLPTPPSSRGCGACASTRDEARAFGQAGQ